MPWRRATPATGASAHCIPRRDQSGRVVLVDGDVYGDGVNVAARLEQLAERGGVMVSGTG